MAACPDLCSCQKTFILLPQHHHTQHSTKSPPQQRADLSQWSTACWMECSSELVHTGATFIVEKYQCADLPVRPSTRCWIFPCQQLLSVAFVGTQCADMVRPTMVLLQLYKIPVCFGSTSSIPICLQSSICINDLTNCFTLLLMLYIIAY